MGRLVRVALGLVLGLAGCFGGEEMAPDRTPPGAQDPQAAPVWRQQVWWRPQQGMRLETLVPGDDGSIATFVSAGNQRSAFRVTGPFAIARAQPIVRPSAPPSRSTTSDDGSLRAVLVPTGDRVTLKLLGPDGGKELTTFDGARDPSDPVFLADGSGLVMRVGGAQPGLAYVPVAGGPAEMLVEGDVVAFVPAVLEGEAGVLYGEREGPLVMTVRGDEPLRPARVLVGEMALPGDLVPVLEGTDGSLLLENPCGEAPRLAIRSAEEGLRFGQALAAWGEACGDGCTAWYGPAKGAGARVLVRLQELAEGRYEVLLDREVGLDGEHWVTGERAATLPRLPGCLDAPSDNLLLARRVWTGTGAEALLVIPAGFGVERADGAARQRIDLTPSGPSDPVAVESAQASPDPLEAVDPEGAVLRATEDQAIVREVDGAEPVVLLGPAETRQVTGVAPDARAGVAWFTDQGAFDGLYRAQAGVEEAMAGVTLDGLSRPVAGRWGEDFALAMLRQVADGQEVWVATRVPEEEVAAWREGPVSLLTLEPTWLPVRVAEDGAVTRCEGTVLRLGADADGGFLQIETPGVPPERQPARGMAVHSPVGLTVLAEGGATPRLLASIRVTQQATHWWLHEASVPVVGEAWLSEAEAADLPVAGPCAP